MLKTTFLTLALVANATATSIQPSLLNSFKTLEKVNILVNFVGGNAAVVNAIELQSFATRTDRLNTLKRNLERHAENSQKDVKGFLQEKAVPFRAFWASNQISIKGATKDIALALSQFPEVEEVREAPVITFPTLIPGKSIARQEDVEWGIERIQANEAWRITNGSGAVVANIDSGVRYTHEALRGNWRSNYGWMSPSGREPEPHDYLGHGSHTMGTIAGSNGVGVAPGATWIACGAQSSAEDFLACGEWMLCPTLSDGRDPDCSMAPHVVSNSWSYEGYDPFYERITEAWIAALIIPVSSSGNTGPTCGSANRSPGGYRRVISCGSTNVGHRLSSFSSTGPGPNARIKPIVSAPGEDVRSCSRNSDTTYEVNSGTSMSTPHVAGVIGLYKSIRPDATFGEVRQALIDATFNDDLVPRNESCGGMNDSDGFPNHHFGYGQVNALRMVEIARKNNMN